MADFTKADQKRVTFLSIYKTLEGDYDEATSVVKRLEEDGFFDKGKSGGRSSGRNGRSDKRGSGSSRGKGGGGGGMRDPDGPPTDKQVATVLKNTDDYTEDELYDDMTKKEVSELIDDLFNS